MRTIRRIAAGAAGGLTALGLGFGIGAGGVASASARPAASHLPVVISATGHANRAIGTYRAGRVVITLGGPDAYARGLHWTQWNSTSATAHGTLVLSDASTWTVPGVTLRFYHPETGGNGVRYFERLHISGGASSKSIAPYWHWAWNDGNYAG